MNNETPLIQAVRNAIHAEKLEAVFRAAGAQEVSGQAGEVLREVAAAEAVRKSRSPLALTRIDAKVAEAARGAFDAKAVGSLAPAGLVARLTSEISAIAVAAAEAARAEDRPVCHNCVAIGAARIASAELRSAEAVEHNS